MKKLLIILTTLTIISSCAWWGDKKKDYKSDITGIKRKVEVYTLDGKLLKEYEGVIRLRGSTDTIRTTINLINENNRRVTIDNAIVITEEIK